jgi:hypothetical protein
MDVPASVAQCKESEGRLEWSGRCRIEQHIDLELKPFSHRVGHTLAADWSPDEEVGRVRLRPSKGSRHGLLDSAKRNLQNSSSPCHRTGSSFTSRNTRPAPTPRVTTWSCFRGRPFLHGHDPMSWRPSQPDQRSRACLLNRSHGWENQLPPDLERRCHGSLMCDVRMKGRHGGWVEDKDEQGLSPWHEECLGRWCSFAGRTSGNQCLP